VQRAILELDHFPAGMELFPAGDDSAWDLIEDVIEASDYYALIIGGRYGSMDEAGIGFTEKEYDLAISLKKPVIPLLHKRPDNLPREKTETDAGAWKKLEEFRAKVEKKHTCVYWESASELRSQVIVGLMSAFKRHPAEGWVRASEVPTEGTLKEALALRKRVAELEQQVAASETTPPPGSANLLQGDDEYEIPYRFAAKLPGDTFGDHTLTFESKLSLTWSEIFAAVAPSMINEEQDFRLKWGLKRYFEKQATEQVSTSPKTKGRRLDDFKFDDFVLDTCVVQFRALGLIRENKRARSVKDTSTYWTLTPFGDYTMVQLRALRRTPTAHIAPAPEVELKPNASAA